MKNSRSRSLTSVMVGATSTGSLDARSIFLEAPTYNSGGFLAESIAVGDLNGDGKPDLVVANRCAINNCPTNGNGSVLSVLLGNSDGTFQAAQNYSSGAFDAWSVSIADVNGDGKPDLVVANGCATSSSCGTGNGVLGVLLGNGDGTFQAAQTYNSGGSGSDSVVVTDINGDGRLDLVVANNCPSGINCSTGTVDSAVSALLGNGDGTFQAPHTFDSGGWEAVSVAAADVNGDGKPDIVVANECADSSNCNYATVGVLLGNGDGTFQPTQSYNVGGMWAESVAVGDISEDGKPDLVVANFFDGSVGILLGNGNGTFQPVQSYSPGGSEPSSIVLADLNADGKPDLVVANDCASGNTCGTGSVGVLFGNGDGTFQAAQTYSSGRQGALSIAVGDVNGNGKPDLVIANCSLSTYVCSNNGMVEVLLGNGDGTFQQAQSYSSGGSDPDSIALADVNGDGKLDVVVANENGSGNSGSVGVLLGNGDGTFQSVQTYSSGGMWVESVAVADVNGDGKPDLIVANCGSDMCGFSNGWVGVLLGNGDGTFQPAKMSSSGGTWAESIVVGDVNGDGKPDLLVANQCGDIDGNCSGSDLVGVLLGNGDGTFEAAVSYSSGGQDGLSVAVADVNGDGKLDLAVANGCATISDCSKGSVAVLLGNGDGTFQAALLTNLPGTLDQGKIALADFNGDGHLDVAIGSGGVLLLGNGDGTFKTPLNLGASGPGTAVGDFNCDGSPDLAVGGVTILLNRATRMRQTTTALNSGLNPSNFGQVVNLNATVSFQGCGAPTGTVSFYDNSTGTNLGSLPLNNRGVATLSTSTLGPSTHSIIATYSGDANFASSVSPVLIQVVLGAAAKYSPTSLSFGNQTVAMTSVPQTFTLANTGDIPLTLYSITIAGANPANFTQTNNCGLALAGQASCTISVIFLPSAIGTRSAAVTFSDNAPSKVQKVLLTGVGVLPAVTFSPTSLTFPTRVVYTSSPAQTVTLTNTGVGTLNISKIGASGPFHETNNCGSNMSPGSTCTLTVTFRPIMIGSLGGAISVTDNAPASPQKVELMGIGTAVQLTPISLGFGNQPTGTTSLAKTITLSNKSHAMVNITSIAITGTNTGDFSETNTCGKSVQAGASCFLKVKFTLSAKGKRTAMVSVSDDGGGSPQKVGLAGTGT